MLYRFLVIPITKKRLLEREAQFAWIYRKDFPDCGRGRDDRLDSWNKEAAVAANQVVSDIGLDRKGLAEETLNGYIAAFLDGIGLRAPYLHNGWVPTLRDLLEPAAARPRAFYRGYDVYDPKNGGFVSDVAEEDGRSVFRYDTALPRQRQRRS